MLKFEIVGLILLAIFAGALIPVQTGYNAELARGLKSPIIASLMVFVSGMLGLALVALVSRAALPTVEAAAAVPFTAWFAGGALAATYVVILVLAAPKLGAGATVAFVVLGQILASVTIDHFGILEFPLHPLSGARFAGVALMIAGVALVKFF